MTQDLKDLMMLIEMFNPEHKPMSIEFINALAERLPLKLDVRRAQWVKTGRTSPVDGAEEHKCSNCGSSFNSWYKYCPNCGAYMPKVI